MAKKDEIRMDRFTTKKGDLHKYTPEEKEKLFKELGREPLVNDNGNRNQD